MNKKILFWALITNSLSLLSVNEQQYNPDDAKAVAEIVITGKIQNKAKYLSLLFQSKGHLFSVADIEKLQALLFERKKTYENDYRFSTERLIFLNEYEPILSALLQAPAMVDEYHKNRIRFLN